MKLLLLLILLFVQFGFAQQMFENGDLELTYVNAKNVSKRFNLNSSSKSNSDDLYKIEVKFKVKSLKKSDVDINKFALVDHVNHLRYRPSDISYATMGLYMGYVPLLKTELEDNRFFTNQISAKYKPEIHDSFPDFKLTNYQDIEIPTNFGNKNYPLLSVVYFWPHDYKNYKVKMYFYCLVQAENPEFELYYGDKVFSKISLK